MKTSGGVIYNSSNSKQAKRLEDAINDLDLTLEIGSFSPSFNPPVLVYEKDVNQIVIRPNQGRFSKIKFGKKVKVMNISDYVENCNDPRERLDLLFIEPAYVAFYKEKKYFIATQPISGI